MPNIHIVDRYMKTIEHLGIKNDNQGLDYFIPELDKVRLEDIIDSIRPSTYIAYAIGGQHFTKNYQHQKLSKFAKTLIQPYCYWVEKKTLKQVKSFKRLLEIKLSMHVGSII